LIVRASLGLDGLRDRVEQVLWVVEYVDDLDADFLAIYGVDDMLALSGRRWLTLARRLDAYEGVMARRLRDLSQQPGGAATATTATEVRTDTALAAVIDLG
jgi:hypothetical protein